MHRKRIASDIDGVICQWSEVVLAAYNNIKGTSYRIEDIKVYNIEEALGIPDPDEFYKIASSIPLDTMPAYDENVAALKRIAANGVSIDFVTARDFSQINKTEFWLEAQGIPFSNLISSSKYPKWVFIDESEYDFMIEDSADHANGIAQYSKLPVFLIDQPWNRNYPLDKLVTRVHSIEDIEKHVSNKSL